MVETWITRGEGRPTLCFAVDRAHAKHLQTQFLEANIPAGYIDAYTTASERTELARQFHAGEVKVVCNVGCLTTGIDWDVRCIILARPTKSEMLFVQMVGRGLRTATGKPDCLILDHSDNHARLGFVTDVYHDKLDDGRERPKAKPKEREALSKKCPQCSFLRPPKVNECPCCGFAPKPICRIGHQDGELVEFASRTTPKVDAIEGMRFYGELKAVAAERRYQRGWIAHNFGERMGHWPPARYEGLPPIEPSQPTRNWVKSRQIAYAKAVEGAARR